MKSFLMVRMTTSPHKTDDPVFGDVAKILLLAQFLGIKRSETQILGHILIYYHFGPAIPVVLGDLKCHRHGRSRCQQRGALRRLVRRLLCHKIASFHQNLCDVGFSVSAEAKDA